MSVFLPDGRVSRSSETLARILDAANRTEEILAIADEIEPFVQEYGMAAVHLRGRHRETGLVVILKVGTSECENRWTAELHDISPDLVPRIYASGSRLGGIEVHWLALEAIPFGPLGTAWKGREFDLLLDAGVRFYRVARGIQDGTLKATTPEDIHRWIDRALAQKPPGPVERLIDQVDAHWSLVAEKCGPEIAFDDFHLCNALTRNPPPDGGPAVLIDIRPRVQPWILDVTYLQVLNSGDRKRPGYRDLTRRMAARRGEAGLATLEGQDLEAAGRVALGWMAVRQWRPEFVAWQPDYREAYERFITEAAQV